MAKTPAAGDASASAAGNAETQFQQTSGEAERKAETPERRAESTNEPQYFEGTVVKIDKDGNEVMSDHLLPGETLRRAVTDLHYANPAQAHADEDERRETAKRDAEQNRKAAERNADDLANKDKK